MSVVVRRFIDPEDAALGGLSRLMHATFADPDTVLELDRIQVFLAEQGDGSPGAARLPAVATDQGGSGSQRSHGVAQRRADQDASPAAGPRTRAPQRQAAAPGRQFCVVVAEEEGIVLGGTVFSYVPASNCGFSEYLLVRKDIQGRGIGRLLFDARRAVLDELARASTHQSCDGLFIEADSPERTPPDLLARERETAMDALTRLQVFAHLGFRRVEIDYIQPPLGPDKQPVSYLDLLFAAWPDDVPQQEHVPAAWVAETLCPIWRSWAPATASEACVALRQRLGDDPVALLALPA